jgi:putative ABC transport system permease protein
MPRLKLFYRLMVRPLFQEPVRIGLTVLAVALGVAVVLAIDLAGSAAAGSFHSSMETLGGNQELEIVASGGVPESVIATLATRPYPIRISPRIEDFAIIAETKQTVPLIGLDLISEGSQILSDASSHGKIEEHNNASLSAEKHWRDTNSAWLSSNLHKHPGDSLELILNDKGFSAIVRGVIPDPGTGSDAILMDIAAAQRALNRFGRVDRILIKLPGNSSPDEWQTRLQGALPPGVEVRPRGTGTTENRKMLSAFRWNLRLLSCIALVVGAFLIYNTISVSVVRRRHEIGIIRALGASRAEVLAAFLGEAACLGIAGALLGIILGRVMATGAVKLMSLTVDALYVSSSPGPIELNASSFAVAIVIGLGVALASAWLPAREAMQVVPADAMAIGRREYTVAINKARNLLIAASFGIFAMAAAELPAVAGKPLFGYVAALSLIIASAFAIPAMVNYLCALTSALFRNILGVEGLLASRSLAASLRRTSVLVAALSTAVAMMVSVAIMVGSFRQTVVAWMDSELPADLYIRPAGNPAADRHPTISLELAEQISELPGIASTDRLRAYEISYQGMPATLASVDIGAQRSYHQSDFFSGRPTEVVLRELREGNNVIVSEPFTSKHHVKTGDYLTLPLGETQAMFRIADVCFDYASERGYILMDRSTMLRYLPDPTPSNLAVFVANGASVENVRAEIVQAAAGSHILIFSDRDLRGEAIRIFDRTFAITYALEAVAVFVAIMGVAGALLALVIDRQREFGLLRFLGASKGQLRKLLLVEAAILGFVANLWGLVLGYFLSLILVFVVNKQSFGWTIHFHWPVAILLGALSTIYLATILAGLFPARVAIRLNPLEVIHEE